MEHSFPTLDDMMCMQRTLPYQPWNSRIPWVQASLLSAQIQEWPYFFLHCLDIKLPPMKLTQLRCQVPGLCVFGSLPLVYDCRRV